MASRTFSSAAFIFSSAAFFRAATGANQGMRTGAFSSARSSGVYFRYTFFTCSEGVRRSLTSPTHESAWTALRAAVRRAYHAPSLGTDREWVQRTRLVRTHPSLLARQLAHQHALARDLTQALKGRRLPTGMTRPELLVAAALSALRIALEEWIDVDDDCFAVAQRALITRLHPGHGVSVLRRRARRPTSRSVGRIAPAQTGQQETSARAAATTSAGTGMIASSSGPL